MLFFLKNNYSSKKFLKVFFSVLALIFINYPALAEYKPGTGVHDARENIIKQVLLETGKKFGWDQRACFYSIHKYSTMQGLKEEKIRHCPKIVGPNIQYDIDKKDANGHFMQMNCSAYFLTVYAPPKGIKSGGTLPEGAMMVETSPIKITAYPSEALAESAMKDEIKSVPQKNKIVVAKMGKKWASKIIKFHGTDAIQNISAGLDWQMGRFMFSVFSHSYDPVLKGTIVDVPYMKVANTLYDNIKSYGLIGKGASPQDSDSDGVPDTEDKCPNTPSGVAVDARGCAIIKEMSLTLSTDKKAYATGETVVIKGKISNEKGALAGASVVIDIKGTKLNATSDTSGNYRLKFPIPSDMAQGAYTITATASHANYPSRKKSTSFVVGKIGIQLEENSVTGKPFVGVAADGVSSLRISISLPGCSDAKINKPDIGKLKGDAINVLGNVNLDSTGVAEITYYPPDYLTKDQLTKNLNVHKSNAKTWVAEVPLTLTYKDVNGDAKKLESKILVCRPPVMLVHGFLGGPATWGKLSTTLRGEKFDTYLGDYGATGQSIEGLALILKNDIRKQKIDYAKANIKLEKVDIVGHSMGGLISRYYTHGRVPANYPGDVRKLIMVGTPNHGVSWTEMIIGYIGSETFETHRVPALQLSSESQFMKIVNYGEKTGAHLDPDIQYGNIYGFPDDWVVSAASAYLNGVVHISEFDVKHSPDISKVPAVAITEYRKTWNQVNKWLTSDIYRPPLKGSHVEIYKYHGDVYLNEGKLTSSPAKFDSWGSLRTDKNSTAVVHLTLNGRPWGAILLDPESEIFLGYTSPQLVEVRLWKGTATFKSGKNGHFTVPVHIKRSKNGEWWRYSPKAVVTGRGTEFVVRAGENIEVHCLEGELVVNTPNATKGSILSANKSVAVTGENIVAITPVSKGDFWWSTENDNFLGNSSNTTSGLLVHNATIKDWDQRHEAFSFSLGKVTTKEGIGDFFIADRGDKSIIHVFDSPGIIDMGAVPLDSISKAPKSGYKEVVKPIEGHAYVIRSQGKYGKIRIQRITRPPLRAVTEYEIAWAYLSDGTKSFGASTTPTSSSPTIPTIASSADAYVYAYNYRNWNRSNRGKYDKLAAGWHPTGGESRAYIKFDLSNVDPSKVNKAILKLYHFPTAGNDNVDLGIYRVTEPWKEGTDTYHSGHTEKTAAPGEISWVQQPPINSTPIATFNPGAGLYDWTKVDITPLVKQWLRGTPNYGLVIKSIGHLGRNVGASVYGFASRERDSNLDRPKGESKAPTLILSANPNNKTQNTIKFSPHDWQPHNNGDGHYSIKSDQICMNSMNPGGVWFTKKRPYDFKNDYSVEFNFKLNTNNNHWTVLYSDGFVYVHIDWGTTFGWYQPGASYNEKTSKSLVTNKWYKLKVNAKPSQNKFDIYLDNKYLGTATNIKPLHEYHTTSAQINDKSVIWFGDSDSKNYRGGSYNKGDVCWKNIVFSEVSNDPNPIYRNKENIWTLNSNNFIYRWNGGNWDHFTGTAQDIGVGANGSVWIMDTENHRYGGSIYRLEGSNFVKTSGQGVRIDVDPYGNPWVINNLSNIYKWGNNAWHRMPGLAKDIGISANGDVWIIGTDASNGNYGIYKWSGSQWVKFPGAAVRIDVGPRGTPWIVNAAGNIYRWDNHKWIEMPGKAKDISVSSNGTVWIIGTDNIIGGHSIFKWNGAKWIKIPGAATVISVGGKK